MSFWIAGATLAVGAYSANQAGEAADKSNSLSRQSIQIQQDQLEFAQQQYDDWLNIYGPVQEQLANFYADLTPEFIESQGLQAQQQAYQQQQQQLSEYFAVNNIESGVAADVYAATSLENVRQQATIRAEAPIKAAEAQSGFLSIGLGQGAQKEQSILNAGSNLANTTSSLAQSSAQQAQLGYQTAGNAFFQGMNTIIRANSGRPELDSAAPANSAQYNYYQSEYDDPDGYDETEIF